jgi:hypothetical protein
VRDNTIRGARAWLPAAGLSIILAAGLAACGGSSTKATSSPSTTAKAGTASTAAYTSCLEQHGIPSSAASQLAAGGRRGLGGGGARGPESGGTPPSLPGGVTAAQLRTANQACRSLNPNRGRFGGGPLNSAAFAAYRNCLQLHGVTLPTPGSSTTTSSTAAGASPSSSTPGGGRGFGGLDPSNPTVQAAMQACAALRPGANGSTTSTTAAA